MDHFQNSRQQTPGIIRYAKKCLASLSTQTHSLTFTKTFHQPIDLLRNEDTTLASTCVEFFYLLQSTTMVSLGSCIIQ
jgi:hypothetical protein